jgi:TetR/AcrR family transcriptional regulator, transcriptional repressor for nem operon
VLQPNPNHVPNNGSSNGLSNNIAQFTNPISQAIAIVDRIEKIHAEDINCPGCLLGNLIVDLAEYDPSFRHHLIRVYDEWQSIVAQKIIIGRSQLKPEIKPEYLAEQVLIIIEGTLLLGRLYNDQDRLHRGFDIARNLLKQAIA